MTMSLATVVALCVRHMVLVVVRHTGLGLAVVASVSGVMGNGNGNYWRFSFLLLLEMVNTACYSLDNDRQSYHFLLPTGGSEIGYWPVC
jgi:hypothetical protein